MADDSCDRPDLSGLMPPLSLAVDTSILDAVIVAAGYGWGQMSPCVTGAVDVFRGQLWLCDLPLTDAPSFSYSSRVNYLVAGGLFIFSNRFL